MFDKIFGLEATLFMVHLQDGIEDLDKVEEFKHRFIDRMDYVTTIMLARNWSAMTELNQVKTAIRYMGEHDASRFMIYMDYLAKKIELGGIK